MRRCRVLTLAALLCLPIARPAHAAWTHDPAGGGVPVSLAQYGIGRSASLADGSGGAFLVWEDQRSGYSSLYAQHLDVAGVPQWGANGIPVTSSIFSQYSPSLALDGAGGVLIAWEDFRSFASYDIYAQRLGPSGAPMWGAAGLALCTAAGDQTGAALVPDGTGGAFVAWSDPRGADSDIYVQRVNAGGAIQLAANGVAVTSVMGTQSNVRGIGDASGGALFAWQDNRSGNYDIYAQRVSSSNTMAWTANGVVVCNAAADQTTPALCIDGGGGAIVAWTDARLGSTDIYAQHLWYPGIGLWTANGVVVCGQANLQSNPQVVADGQGGALVVWGDSRIGYSGPAAQHVSALGALQWAGNGILLAAASASSNIFSTAPDGLGGVLVSWQDYRLVSSNTFVQRLTPAGANTWAAGGVCVDITPFQNDQNTVAADGSGGAIVAAAQWRFPNSSSNDLFAYHIDQFGVFGGEPQIASVKDVPNDNGGHVKVSWYASPLDLDPASYAATSYLVFRSAPPNVAAQAVRENRVTRSLDVLAAAGPGRAPLWEQRFAANVYFWELIGTQAAYHLPTYSLVASTTGDSMGAGNARTAFLVQARNTSGSQWWTSAADSGYSVDNVPPIVPAPFTGQYATGTTRLHWDPNPEADLAGYRLYRGASLSFTPEAGNRIAAPADTGWTDPAGSPYVYKLTALDIHGNESPVATLLPTGTLDAGGTVAPRALALAPPSPNPAGRSTSVRYELPRSAHVRLALFDAAGRQVRLLADGAQAAGAYSLRLALRDDAGRPLPAGLYLVRLQAEGRSLTRRLVAMP